MAGEKGVVLVVDDNRHILDTVKEMLSKAGYTVITAGSGAVALEILQTETPKCVLLDIKMPGMDGFEVLKAIKDKYSDVPVIMMTAFGYEDGLIDRALGMGAIGYIGKDMPRENFLSTFDWISERAAKGKLTKKSASIIVIDDDKQMCALLKEFLEKNGFKVTTLSESEHAATTVRKENPDLVILDAVMPKLSGVEVLERIRQFSRSVKVIMISISKDETSAKKCQALGACEYITKPFTLEFLLDKINEKL